ncbi:hypothetical protein DZC30_02495 [Comamonas testosteroni]|uniref:Tyr recombinase domain-containing protein n=1 Tax=Comamonas testosteroni TaxID=285 RepID=A0A373FT72_COMTE|nr:site-specific integrase [Comamonas testosteroni]RGE46665.1 hypothetical protein DZC30_02495 [Comamonas testosteroni]
MATFSSFSDVLNAPPPADGKPFVEMSHSSQPGFIARVSATTARGEHKRYYVVRYKELQSTGKYKDKKKTLGIAKDLGTGENVLTFDDAKTIALRYITRTKANSSGQRIKMTVGEAAGLLHDSLDSPFSVESESYKVKLRNNYRNYLQPLEHKGLEDLKVPFWKSFRDGLRTGELAVNKKKQPLSVATIEGIFSCISRLYSIAHENNGIVDEPLGWNPALAAMKKTEPANQRSTFIPLDKLGKAWLGSGELMAPGWRDMFRIYLLTGLRDSLVRDLRWENIDLEEGVLYIKPLSPGAKDRKAHLSAAARLIDKRLPLSELALEILRYRRHFAPKDNPWVFYGESGDKTRKGSERLQDPRSAWRALEEYIGMHVSKHDLRRTFASLACTVAPQHLPHISLLLMHSNKMIASFIGVPQITLDYIKGQESAMRTVADSVGYAIEEIIGKRPKSALTKDVRSYVIPQFILKQLDAESDAAIAVAEARQIASHKRYNLGITWTP